MNQPRVDIGLDTAFSSVKNLFIECNAFSRLKNIKQSHHDLVKRCLKPYSLDTDRAFGTKLT